MNPLLRVIFCMGAVTLSLLTLDPVRTAAFQKDEQGKLREAIPDLPKNVLENLFDHQREWGGFDQEESDWEGLLLDGKTEGPNLVINGGFEDGLTGWSGGALDFNDPHGGQACLRIEDNDPNADVNAHTTDIIPIDRTRPYRLELWIRGEQEWQQAMVSINQFDSNGNWIALNNIDIAISVNNDWSLLSLVLRHFHQNTAAVQIFLRPAVWTENGDQTGTAWFDDLLFAETEIEAESTQGNWILNSAKLDIWQSPIEQKIRLGMSLPADAPVRRAVKLFAACGEAEAFQLVLLAKNPNETLMDIRFPKLEGPKRAHIDPSAFSAREVAYVEVKIPTGATSYSGWVPDPLPLLNLPLALRNDSQQRTLQPLWFSLKVPPGTPAGIYTGHLRMKFAIAGWVSVPIHLRVWDFDLPKEHHLRTSYGLWLGDIDRYHNLGGDREKRRQVFQRYLQDFKDHRISPKDIIGDDSWSIFYRNRRNGSLIGEWQGGTIVNDPDNPSGPNRVMEVSDDQTADNVHASVTPIFPIGKDDPYKLSWRVKTDGARDYWIAINQYDAAGNFIGGANVDIPRAGNGSWQEEDYFIPADKWDTRMAKVGITLYACPWSEKGECTGRTWFDDLGLRPLTRAGEVLIETFEGVPVEDIQVEADFSKFDEAATYGLDGLGFDSFELIGQIRLLPGFAFGFQDDFKPGRILNFEWGTLEYEAIFAKTLRVITDHMASRGWLERAYAYWYDEPAKKKYPEVEYGMSLIKSADLRLKRLLTVDVGRDSSLNSSVDIWVPLINNYNPNWVKDRRNEGGEVWSYVACFPRVAYPNYFIDHPGIEQRILSWMAWHYGFEGFLYWSTNYYFSNDGINNPWFNPMSVDNYLTNNNFGNGDGRLVYPPRNYTDGIPRIEGPTPSIRWELIREGLEDYEYFWMLKKAADELEERGIRPHLLAKARELLTIHDSIIGSFVHFTDDPRALRIHRIQMARVLENILRALKHDVGIQKKLTN